MIRESSHTACHFPDFGKDSATLSDGIFLAELEAQAWHSRQGMRQGEPQGCRKILSRAPQKPALG